MARYEMDQRRRADVMASSLRDLAMAVHGLKHIIGACTAEECEELWRQLGPLVLDLQQIENDTLRVRD